jgi:DNA-binding NarL/FixJ family response regulator
MVSKQKNGTIRVAILDDHQSTIDGYAFRLKDHDHIQVVATARYGSEVEGILAENDIDLLVLDISMPTSKEDRNPYPLLYVLPKLREQYPDTTILIISMHKHRSLMRALMQAGAKGYILKDDRKAILQLGDIITSMAAGGVYFSEQSYAVMSEDQTGGDDVKPLTPRQVQVLSLSAAYPDMSTAKLADQLEIAPSTLRNLMSESYLRLGVRNRAAAIAKARQLGLITPYPPDPTH